MEVKRWAEGLITDSQQEIKPRPSFPEFLLPNPDTAPPERSQPKRQRYSGSTFLEPGITIKTTGSAENRSIQGLPSVSRSASHASEGFSTQSSLGYRKRARKKPSVALHRRADTKANGLKTEKKREVSRSRMVDGKKGNRQKSAKPPEHPRPFIKATYPKRLTLRQDGTGIFGTAKSSAHRRPVEVPDLSFSRMGFANHETTVVDWREATSSSRCDDADTASEQQVKNFPLNHVPRKRLSRRTEVEHCSSDWVYSQQGNIESRSPPIDCGATALHASESMSWSVSGRPSSRMGNSPSGPGTIEPSRFTFRAGPYRSSSMRDVAGSVDSLESATEPKADIKPRPSDCPEASFSGKSRRHAIKISWPSTHAHVRGGDKPPASENNLPDAILRLRSAKARDHDTKELFLGMERYPAARYSRSSMSPVDTTRLECSEVSAPSISTLTFALHQCQAVKQNIDSTIQDPAPRTLDSITHFYEEQCSHHKCPSLSRSKRSVRPVIDPYSYENGETNYHETVSRRKSPAMEEAKPHQVLKEFLSYPQICHDPDRSLQYEYVEEEVFSCLDVHQEVQEDSMLNLPFVGGFDQEFILVHEEERRSPESRAGFWRPNRLY